MKSYSSFFSFSHRFQKGFISSAGLRILLSLQKAMNRLGSMKVIHVNEIVSEVFDVTGFSDILTIE